MYMVVYRHGALRSARINASTGLLIDNQNMLADLGAEFPDVDYDGTNFLVVAQTTDHNIVGIFVTPTNTPSPFFVIEGASGDQTHPRVRWNGKIYTVVFEDNRNAGTTGSDVYAAQLDATGSVLGSFPVASSTDNEYGPVIGIRNGSEIEVAYWRGPSTTLFDFDVWGQSLKKGGTSGFPFAISNGVGIREMTPDIACNNDFKCTTPYRWFNTADTTTESDRIKARLIGY